MTVKKTALSKVWPGLAGGLCILLVGVMMLALGWRKWLDPVVDFGRELYIPWQICEGQVLYRDLAYFNGPLSPYFNALVFKLFGPSLMSLVWTNIAILGLLTLIIYRLLRSVGSRLAAVLGCISFLVMFGLAQFTNTANYNFVCPYSHELSHGLFLSLLSIYLFYRYMLRPAPLLLGLMGLCWGLVLLTKVEVFLALSAALVVALALLYHYQRPSARRLPILLGVLVLGFIGPVVCWAVYLGLQMGFAEGVESIFTGYIAAFEGGLASQKFYRAMAGLDEPGRNMLSIAKVVGWYVLLLGGVLIFVRLVGRLKNYGKISWVIVLIVAATVAVLGFFTANWLEALRPLGVFLLVIGCGLVVKLRLSSEDAQGRQRLGVALVLVVFSLILLAKMNLDVHVWQYGFALAGPGALILIVALVDWVPGWMKGKFVSGWTARPIMVAVLLAALVWHFDASRRRYAIAKQQISSGADAFVSTAWPKGAAFSQALANLDKVIGADETFVVLPEGVMFNYLSRRQSPTKYISFMPAELAIFSEEPMLESLKENPPDYVLLLPRDLSEYGYEGFGKDYCLKLTDWLNTNYGQMILLGQARNRTKKTSYSIYLAKRITQ